MFPTVGFGCLKRSESRIEVLDLNYRQWAQDLLDTTVGPLVDELVKRHGQAPLFEDQTYCIRPVVRAVDAEDLGLDADSPEAQDLTDAELHLPGVEMTFRRNTDISDPTTGRTVTLPFKHYFGLVYTSEAQENPNAFDPDHWWEVLQCWVTEADCHAASAKANPTTITHDYSNLPLAKQAEFDRLPIRHYEVEND